MTCRDSLGQPGDLIVPHSGGGVPATGGLDGLSLADHACQPFHIVISYTVEPHNWQRFMSSVINRVSNRRGRRRSRSRWRSPISLDDVSALIVVSVLLLMPLLTIEIAGWAVDLDTVLPITLFSVAFGWIVARSRFGELPL